MAEGNDDTIAQDFTFYRTYATADNDMSMEAVWRLRYHLKDPYKMDILINNGVLEILRQVLSRADLNIQLKTIDVWCNALKEICESQPLIPPVFATLSTPFAFLRDEILGKTENHHLSGPVFGLMHFLSINPNSEVKRLVESTFPIQVVKRISVVDIAPVLRDVFFIAYKQMFLSTMPDGSVLTKETLQVLVNICENPDTQCSTIRAICLTLKDYINVREPHEPLSLLANSNLILRIANHVTHANLYCEKVCVSAILDLMKLFFGVTQALTVKFVTQDILSIVDMVLNTKSLDAFTIHGLIVIAKCVEAGGPCIDIVVKRGLLSSATRVLFTQGDANQAQIEAIYGAFTECASVAQINALYQSDFTRYLKLCIKNGCKEAILICLKAIKKMGARVEPNITIFRKELREQRILHVLDNVVQEGTPENARAAQDVLNILK